MVIILPLNLSFAKVKFTYSLIQLAIPSTIDNEKYVYSTTVSDPDKDYVYNVDLSIGDYRGALPEMRFTFNIVNGKFSNGKTAITMSYDSLRADNLHVKWNDITSNNLIDTAFTATIKITQGVILPTDSSAFELQKGTIQKFVRKIASLKGQVPSLGAGPNRLINDNSQIVAIVTDMEYPGINEGNESKKVKQFEWTLPDGWKTINNESGTFITSIDVKQITVIPNKVTVGSIKVRGVNGIGSAYSEYDSIYFDRGFLFTTYPTSITFGDNSPKTFATTLFSGITYEWSVPVGWKINGQGNVLEGLNMNSISVTPEFCLLTDTKVKVSVRLKKDGEVSGWTVCKGFQGVLEPGITTSSSIYQLEEVSFILQNVSLSSVQSVTWSGNGVSTDVTYKIMYTQPGAQTLYATVLFNGCSTPIVIKKEINVLPHRVSLTGPSMFCNQGAYTVNNLSNGATISWTSDIQNIVSIQSSGNTATLTKINSGIIKLGAKLYYGQNNYLNLNIDISVSPISAIGLSSYNNLLMLDGDGVLFRILPAIDAYPYRGSLVVSAGSSNSFTWSQVSSYPNDIKWSANGASVDVYSRFANKTIVLKCTATSTCNTSSKNYTFTTNSLIVEPMSISPNPAISEVTVSLDEDESDINLLTASSETTQKKSYTIQLWSSTGLIKSVVSNDSKYKLSLQGVPPGFYYIHMSSGDKTYRKQLIVK